MTADPESPRLRVRELPWVRRVTCYHARMPTPAGDIVLFNGEFVPRDRATLDLEDRAAMFADGVYEVLVCFNGRPFEADLHRQRFQRSLREVGIDEPAVIADLDSWTRQLLQRNQRTDAQVYWQVSRGVGPRDFHIDPDLTPTVFALARPIRPLRELTAEVRSVRGIVMEDQRWNRCDIKTLMLMPGVLALDDAKRRGGDLAILHRDGVVTESSSANVIIVRDGVALTHPADHHILHGVTRRVALELANGLGIDLREAYFTVDELEAADEVMICGTTSLITAVTEVDAKPIADGEVGPVTRRLHQAMYERIATACELH